MIGRYGIRQTHFRTNSVRERLHRQATLPDDSQKMEITGLEPAAYALRTHRYPSLAISPYKFILSYQKEKASKNIYFFFLYRRKYQPIPVQSASSQPIGTEIQIHVTPIWGIADNAYARITLVPREITVNTTDIPGLCTAR